MWVSRADRVRESMPDCLRMTLRVCLSTWGRHWEALDARLPPDGLGDVGQLSPPQMGWAREMTEQARVALSKRASDVRRRYGKGK